MSRVNFFTETFHDFQCWCFYLFFIFSCTNWEARRMCCHNVIWSILVMLEFMTCSAPLQTWKMLTRGFFATQEQVSTNHKVYWHQIVTGVKKKRDQIYSFTHSHLTFFADTLRSHFCSGAKKMSFVLMTDLSLVCSTLCSPGTAGSDNLPGPAEISCCSRFLKLNNHRVQSY